MNEAVENALKAARALCVIDELSPAEHNFELEKRSEARKRVIDMIDAALATNE